MKSQPETKREFKRSLLQEVKSGNYIEVFKQLCVPWIRETELNAQDALGNSLAHWAIRWEHDEVLWVLLHFDIDLTMKDIQGWKATSLQTSDEVLKILDLLFSGNFNKDFEVYRREIELGVYVDRSKW